MCITDQLLPAPAVGGHFCYMANSKLGVRSQLLTSSQSVPSQRALVLLFRALGSLAAAGA